MTDYFFDGANGNDTTGAGTEANPYKSIKNSTVGGAFNPANARFFIRRGTTVLMAGEIHPNGSFYIGPYGEGDEAATLVSNNGGTYYLATGTGAAATDDIVFDSMTLIDADTSSVVSGVYQNNAGSGRVIVKDCIIQDFFNGIMTQRGTGHQILRNRITGSRNCGVMVEHASVAAPSNMLIANNYVASSEATNDGIVLHAGTSDGYGNIIQDNVVISGAEQCIDVMQMFPGTLVLRNVCYPGASPTLYEEVFCRGAYSVFAGNLVFTKKRRGMLFDNVGIKAIANTIVSMSGETGGILMQALGTCTNFVALNNAFFMRPGLAFSALLCNTGVTTGTAKNNLFVNESASTSSRFIAAQTTSDLYTWEINNNYYVQIPGSYATPWAAASSFATWQARTGTPDTAGIVATVSPLGRPEYSAIGQQFDLKKLFKIYSDSPLLGVGGHVGYYRDLAGKQFWNPPSIGPVEYTRERARPA